MEGKKNKYSPITLLLVFLLALTWFKLDAQREINKDLRSSLNLYEDALAEANENIDEANDMIYDAQWHAWGSYEEMGEALEDLYAVDNVELYWNSNPLMLRAPKMRLPSRPNPFLKR